MTLTTSNMGLLEGQGSDNGRDYLKTFLANSLIAIDTHDHSSTKGVAVKRLANGTFASRPAAGNAGHIYLSTDSNLLSFDNGSAWQDAPNLSRANTWTNAQTISSGGLVVSAGGLQVTAGNVGVGAAAGAALLTLGGVSNPATTLFEMSGPAFLHHSINGQTFGGVPTSNYIQWLVSTGTGTAQVSALKADGNGDITIGHNLLLPVSTAGPNQTIRLSDNNGGGTSWIYTNTIGGAAGLVRFDVANGTNATDNTSRTTALSLTGDGKVSTGGALVIGSRPAFAAGDKYLIVDASGNVHVSALGPAS